MSETLNRDDKSEKTDCKCLILGRFSSHSRIFSLKCRFIAHANDIVGKVRLFSSKVFYGATQISKAFEVTEVLLSNRYKWNISLKFS